MGTSLMAVKNLRFLPPAEFKRLERSHNSRAAPCLSDGRLSAEGEIMKRSCLFVLGLVACLTFGSAAAENAASGQASKATETQQSGLPDRVISPRDVFGGDSGFDPRYLRKTNLSCGIPPIPPIGCRVGACVCDQYGNNCQWTFICN